MVSLCLPENLLSKKMKFIKHVKVLNVFVVGCLVQRPCCVYPEDVGGGSSGGDWSRLQSRKIKESEGSLKPGKVVPTGPAQRAAQWVN